MDLEQEYLDPASPLWHEVPVFADLTLFRRIQSEISQGMFTQDAIAAALIDRGMRISAGLLRRVQSLNARFKLMPEDIGEILKGYTSALLLVNVAVRCQFNGHAETREYVDQFDERTQAYLKPRIELVHRQLMQDMYCRGLMEYAVAHPDGTSKWSKVGALMAKAEFLVVVEKLTQQ